MSNTFSLIYGWRLKRRDGVILGFSDHDCDLDIDGTLYLASSALSPSEAAAKVGLAPDDQEVSGGLSHDAISADDLAKGVYDGAEVTLMQIDWQAKTAKPVSLFFLGEASRTQIAFTAELRGRAGRLSKKRGRVVSAMCDADLGDHRCGVQGVTFSGRVEAVSGRTIFLSGDVAGAEYDFARGQVIWSSESQNSGLVSECAASEFQKSTSQIALELWRLPPRAIAIGDTLEARAGCDKTFLTCVHTFNNGANFRGFPAMPGDAAQKVAIQDDPELDGGALYDFRK